MSRRARISLRIAAVAIVVGTILLAGGSSAGDLALLRVTESGASAAPDGRLLDALAVVGRRPTWRQAGPEAALDALLGGEPPALARIPAVVHLAAARLGAGTEILAVLSPDGASGPTGRAHVVVRRDAFPEGPPSPGDLRRYLRAEVRTFAYNDRLDAFGYMAAAWFIRQRQLFTTAQGPMETKGGIAAETTGGDADVIRPIRGEHHAAPAGERIALVAGGRADLAAVPGDGGSPPDSGAAVWLVPLETPLLVHDLLVATRALDAASRERLRAALATGTVRGADGAWIDWRRADAARAALRQMEVLVVAAPARVPIQIEVAGDLDRGAPELRHALERAIEISGTEFKVFSRGFDRRPELVWRVEPAGRHDIKIAGRRADRKGWVARTVLDTRDGRELERGIARFLRDGPCRFAWVWPYSPSGRAPIVLLPEPGERKRGAPNGTAAVPAGAPQAVQVQPLIWRDPLRHDYRPAATEPDCPLCRVPVVAVGGAALRLDSGSLQSVVTLAGEKGLDPMSGVSYRVVLERPRPRRASPLAVLGTAILLTLFVTFVLKRRRSGPLGYGPGSPDR